MPKKGKKKGKKGKPRNGEQTYYIDTDHIISYLFEEKDQTFIARGLFGAIFGLSNPQIKVIVPKIAIGEVVSELRNRGAQFDTYKELLELIDRLEADIQPPSQEALNIIPKCFHADDYLGPTDAVIFAQALCDTDSVYLFTFDSILTNSLSLLELEKELRSEGKRRKLNIKPSF